jgi:acetyl-CoA/propionyl-CoA carboxylase biotin carboxyl carrier protein
MNTRIQVEHTVSEMISGIDLVREQILVAAGHKLGMKQDDISFRGHAIEVRVNAEDPALNFRPAPGTISAYREPGGFGVRVDSAAFTGYTISPDYDSMIAKLIVWGRDRAEALQRLGRAIDEYQIAGVPTTLPLLRALIDFPPVVDATYGTATLEPFAALLPPGPATEAGTTVASAAPADDETIRVEVNGRLHRVRFVDLPPAIRGTVRPTRPVPKKGGSSSRSTAAHGNDIIAPMPGVVVDIPVTVGQQVAEGDVVIIIEAMKMMNELRAHKAGVVTTIHAAKGTQVEARAPLVSLG